jgi:DNA-binding transcriptional LysR family regulator
VLQSEASATVQALVGAGLGAAIVPRLAVDGAAAETVVLALDPPDAISARVVALAWNRERRLRKEASAFADVARTVCSELGLLPLRAHTNGVAPLLCA